MWRLSVYYRNILIRKEKRNLLIIFTLSILAAIIDSLSIGLLPAYFYAIIDLNSFFEKIPLFIKNTITSFNYENNLIIYSSVIVLVLFFIKNIFLYLINVFIMFLFLTIREGIMFRSAKNFTYFDYKTYLIFNSANIIRNITGESSNAANCLRDFVLLLQEFFLVIFIISISAFIYPEIILPGIAIIFLASFIFIMFTKKSLKRLGEINVSLRGKFIKTVNHIFGSFKEIKIFKIEKYMLKFFKKDLSNEINNRKKINMISMIPKYLIEILGVMIIIFTLAYFLKLDDDITHHIPTLALFASALIKVMPSAIKMNQIISKMSVTMKSVEVIDNLKKYKFENINQNINFKKPINIDFKNVIEFDGVCFSYLKERGTVIKNLSMEIKKNQLTLILGPSGSGKSTIIDLLTGILKPIKGKITVDGVEIEKNVSGWQKKISYMPQDIYLLDDTIKNNIIFDENSELDILRANKILKSTNLLNFIEKLPNKYDERIGEKANRLSGGQIKRLGLARCLYKNRQILILDEPTSGLDDSNTQSLMNLIKEISKNHTVIIVSHNQKFRLVADNEINISNLS